ncbi:putative disease resistance RPP13-like protein 1 isoform X2 [Prosopis cineraria]|uniref:putative disease resistance RPP13-like protein 1 isoform X2 n=1 Tax=Prosopis cineraria TaxID=364024 RepID=UPI00241073EA|nr:putative disease resistance RPP13-like protein 1 isoform X2 [Prosopis cineraria]
MAELVAGALLTSSIQLALERLASCDILDFFRVRKIQDGFLLKRLDITLNCIDKVIEDAEERQYRDPPVKRWLDELKDAVFRAEDLMDEIATEASRQKLQLQFHPATDEADIYGRDADKERIIEILLSPNMGGNQGPVDVIAIVGMGGVGKTTLAHLVYEDQRMKNKFQHRAWVCASEEFDVVQATKAIHQELNCSTAKSDDLTSYQCQLNEKLMGKSIFLVLDDVWNENRQIWEAFRTPFKDAAQGSKILITTRYIKVAEVMHSSLTYPLKPLQVEDCWKLFVKHAFNDQHHGEDKNFESIGRQIVEKCQGLPLAIKTLGSLLYTEHSCQYWDKILHSDIWNLSEDDSNIIPSLRLSYHYLPSNLKCCFAYCSIFPKGYVIDKDVLIQLWMAEGLLHSNQTRGSIEEVGKEIFNSLKSRSFFEASKESNKYIMHDLLNDLAKSVMGKFCLRLEGDWAQEISRETRYISFPTYDINNLKDISLCHQLRCFLKFQNGYVKGPARHYKQKKDKLFSVFPHLKYMRALSLNGSCNVEGLINNINNLKHLRYLDLSESRIMKLPDSICSMINLQTLKLKNCSLLRKLPSKLYKLINLHHLDLENCVIEKTPKYMGQLKHLRTMTHFAVRKHEGYDLKELGSLNHLRGTLTILNLENASDPMNVQEANLKEKHLYKLDLKWRWIPDRKVPQEQEECILKALQPSYNLKLLFIECYGGVRFPDWLGDPHLNLVSLCLLSCTFCVNLPPLGQLPFLEKLSIGGFDRITVIGPEFYGSGSSTTPFQSLSQLSICEMKQWEEWNISYEGASFPRLQELFICDCPKLKMPLPQHLHLKRLEIHECPNLKTPFPKASTMEELCLQDCGNLSVRQTSMVLGRSASASSCSAIESLA